MSDPGLETAQRIEAGLSAEDVGALNVFLADASEALQGKIRTALANPPLPGREDRWLDRFQDTLTLEESAQVWDAVEQNPGLLPRIMKALAR